MTQEVSEHGNVYFENIPKGVYQVEVVENAYFLRSHREVDLSKEADTKNT